MPQWLFAFLAALAIIGALGTILQRNLVHCVLGFALVLIDLGVLYMGLGAVTVGFLQIIVYVGAIMVLFLFVIWLLNIQADTGVRGGASLGLKLVGALAAAALAAELFVIFSHAPKLREVRTIAPAFGSVATLARVLFSRYLIAFETTSLLLLAAIVGAVALARRLPGQSAEIAVIPSQPGSGAGESHREVA
jgi:NADH-quinone oxidoreductase subunit J